MCSSVDAKTIFPTLNSRNYIEFRDNIKVMATFLIAADRLQSFVDSLWDPLDILVGSLVGSVQLVMGHM